MISQERDGRIRWLDIKTNLKRENLKYHFSFNSNFCVSLSYPETSLILFLQRKQICVDWQNGKLTKWRWHHSKHLAKLFKPLYTFRAVFLLQLENSLFCSKNLFLRKLENLSSLHLGHRLQNFLQCNLSPRVMSPSPHSLNIWDEAGNTKGGSITVQLTFRLTGFD